MSDGATRVAGPGGAATPECTAMRQRLSAPTNSPAHQPARARIACLSRGIPSSEFRDLHPLTRLWSTPPRAQARLRSGTADSPPPETLLAEIHAATLSQRGNHGATFEGCHSSGAGRGGSTPPLP